MCVSERESGVRPTPCTAPPHDRNPLSKLCMQRRLQTNPNLSLQIIIVIAAAHIDTYRAKGSPDDVCVGSIRVELAH